MAHDHGLNVTKGRSTERGLATFLPDPELTRLWCPLISVDDHVLEPPDLFTSRVPERLREAVPAVVEDELGLPHWTFDDERVPVSFGNGASGRPFREYTLAPQRFDEFRRGVCDVDSRVRDMDANGVWASLCFPSIVFGFAGKVFHRMRDPAAGLASLRAYNDWMLDDWCGAHPERFIPCQLTWMPDPAVAAEEIRRNAERGFRAVSFSENPERLGFPHLYTDHWDPFFRACEETGTVVNVHVGSSGQIHRPSSHTPMDATVALFPVNGLETVADWIFAKIPVRFPGLKIVLSEAGVSWVPMMIERLTRSWRQRDASTWWRHDDPDPVDVLHQNFWFTSIEDPSAFQQLSIIGAENVMVEVDYPHADSSWPDSQGLFERDLRHLDTHAIEAICFGNAAALYRHPAPPFSLLASSVVASRHSEVAR